MITVFTTSQCAYCSMVKKYLTMKGKEYQVVDLDDNPEARKNLFDATGAMTVPVTQKGSEYIIGWNPAKLAKI